MRPVACGTQPMPLPHPPVVQLCVAVGGVMKGGQSVNSTTSRRASHGMNTATMAGILRRISSPAQHGEPGRAQDVGGGHQALEIVDVVHEMPGELVHGREVPGDHRSYPRGWASAAGAGEPGIRLACRGVAGQVREAGRG